MCPFVQLLTSFSSLPAEMEGEEGADDDIFYGDLEDSGRSADQLKLIDKVAELTKKNSSLTAELNETRKQLQILADEKSIVENNMIILYNTAQREIGRKEKQLASLMTNERLGASTINNSVANYRR